MKKMYEEKLADQEKNFQTQKKSQEEMKNLQIQMLKE